MNADQPEDTWDEPPEDEADDDPWWANCPHTTMRAVPVTESTSGVDVTIADTSEFGESVSVFLEEYYPPEDDQDGNTIMLTGEAEVLELATTLLGLLSHEFDATPIENDDLDDETWSRAIDRKDLATDGGTRRGSTIVGDPSNPAETASPDDSPEARTVPCPTCGVDSGEPCEYFGGEGAGEARGSPHSKRRTNARDARGDRE